MARDLRSFMDTLEQKAPGELAFVDRQVDPKFEISMILRKLQDANLFPMVLFRNVKNSRIPVISNMMGNLTKLALALETTEEKMVDEYSRREDHLVAARQVESGPVKEVVLTGDKVDLRTIPVLTNCEKDSHPFITAGITVVRDPDTGAYNAGIYRMPVLSERLSAFSVEEHAHANYIFRKVKAEGKALEVVTFIGHHPACYLATQSKLPLGIDEFSIMGAMLGEPLDVVKCETVDLVVPAYAEIAIEGRILPDRTISEAPFGEFTWYYGMERKSPVFEVTAITRRENAIYQHIFAAHPEHNLTGLLGRQAVLYKRVKAIIPSVKAVYLPISGVCRFTAYVSIKKEFDGAGKLAALAALSSDPFVKLAVVVDDDVNVYNDMEVLWAIATRTQADRSIFMVPQASVSRLDPSAYTLTSRGQKDGINTKWAIDATKPIGTPFEERAEVPDGWQKLNLDEYIKKAATSR
jgi:2,5-furandicarboxylate decarboxylase 1